MTWSIFSFLWFLFWVLVRAFTWLDCGLTIDEMRDKLEVVELVEALLLGLRLYLEVSNRLLSDSWGMVLTGVEDTRLLLISSMARLMSF